MKKMLATVAVVFVMILLTGFLCLPAGAERNGEEEAIRGLIIAQQDSWNRGDFEGFMSTYWRSEKLCFQSGNSRLFGWETLLNRYETNYAGEKWGQLSFTDLEITILGGGYAYAIGRYNLNYESEVKQGLFTLILKKFEGGVGWRIVHDHSS